MELTELYALLIFVFIVAFFIVIAVITDAIASITQYTKVVEKQKITYDGKVLSSIYIPMKRGRFKIWHRVKIKILDYSTPKYCAPLYRRNSCNNFNLVVDIVNAEPIYYKDYKLKPIVAYSIDKREDVVVYYCSRYFLFAKPYMVIGTENECKSIIDVFINGGKHSRTIKFDHQAIKKP